MTFLMFLEMPTAGHTVFGDAVATDDAVEVPKHVGLCSCHDPTPEVDDRLEEVGNKAGHSYNDDILTLLSHTRLT